jgi:hypothetical protein
VYTLLLNKSRRLRSRMHRVFILMNAQGQAHTPTAATVKSPYSQINMSVQVERWELPYILQFSFIFILILSSFNLTPSFSLSRCACHQLRSFLH